MKVWIVYQQYPQTGKIEELAAFFSEQNARDRARTAIAGDSSAGVWGVGSAPLVGLRSIEVQDIPGDRI